MGLFSNKKKPVQKSWQRNKSKDYATVPKKREAKRKRKFSRFLFWFFLLIFAGTCVYLILFSPFLMIEKISIEGNRDVAAAEIEKSVEKSLEGNIFGYLPRDNFFLADKRRISSAVRNNFERIEVETIEKVFPATINIKIIERKAELVWCSGGVCYFIDKSGLAYGSTNDPEDHFRENIFLVVVVDDSAIPVDIKKTRINPEFVGFVRTANSMLRDELKIDVTESYHTPGAASGEISVKNGEGWILKISAEYTVEDAKKIIQTLFEKELNDEARKNLEYLDLRVKGKVYYKLR